MLLSSSLQQTKFEKPCQSSNTFNITTRNLSQESTIKATPISFWLKLDFYLPLSHTRYLYYIVIFRSTRTKKPISGKGRGLKVTNGTSINIINGHLFHLECPFKKHFLPDFY